MQPLATSTISSHSSWILVAATHRSGSSLLCQDLRASGRFGTPEEFLEHGTFDAWADRFKFDFTDPFDYLDKVASKTQTVDTGVASLKVMALDLERWEFTNETTLHEYLHQPKYLRISRRDEIGQAVSWAKAISTGEWASYNKANRDPEYSFEQIETCLGWIKSASRFWDQYFLGRDILCLNLIYEDYLADTRGHLQRIADYLEIGLGEQHIDLALEARESGRQKQADDVSAIWRQTFVAEQMSRSTGDGS